MDLDVYFNFIQIVDHGSITSASRQLHIAQSALSKQVQQLEKSFDLQLLIRNPRSVEPTPMGRAFYKHAKELLALEDSFRHKAKKAIPKIQGILKIGTISSRPDYFWEDTLVEFHDAMPLIQLDIHEDRSLDLIYLLQAGLIDVAYVRMPEHKIPKFHQIAGLPAYPAAVFNRDNPWGIQDDGKPATLEDLKNIPLAATRGIESELIAVFKNNGLIPMVFCSVTSRSSAVFWAEKNKAAAIVVADTICESNSPQLFVKKLDIPNMMDITRSTAFIVPKNRAIPEPAQAFVDFLRQRGIYTYQEADTRFEDI